MKSGQQIISFYSDRGVPRRVAVFLSGSGTNAEKILAWERSRPQVAFKVVILVTDRPQTSRARILAERFQLPLIENDIAAFYRGQGLARATLASPEGRQVRQLWTSALQKQLTPFSLDFGVFAGFVPLTNLTATLPCLNIHPGDLTYRRDGQRYLVGLHTVPIELAILAGLDYLRSTVIIAEPYHDDPKHMDHGIILGISDRVTVDLQGHSLPTLRDVASHRPPSRPVSGYNDTLEAVASWNLNRLKEQGDWIVFPQVVEDFSQGKFGKDKAGQLYYAREMNDWQRIDHVVYRREGRQVCVSPCD